MTLEYHRSFSGTRIYCKGATVPSLIDNCADLIKLLSQGGSFRAQPEFYNEVSTV